MKTNHNCCLPSGRLTIAGRKLMQIRAGAAPWPWPKVESQSCGHGQVVKVKNNSQPNAVSGHLVY